MSGSEADEAAPRRATGVGRKLSLRDDDGSFDMEFWDRYTPSERMMLVGRWSRRSMPRKAAIPPNSDFNALSAAFNDAGVEYRLIGGRAYSFHDQPRFTKDYHI
jgi:hypothetical protein